MVEKKEFINFYSKVNPESLYVQESLQNIYNEIACGYYNPAGGEKYGICSSARLKDKNYSKEEAFLALWKISFCANEKFPYVLWEKNKVNKIITYEYSEQFNRWNNLKNGIQKSIDWLKNQSNHCIESMKIIEKPLNLPFIISNDSTKIENDFAIKEKIELIDFANENSLIILLSDAWNDTEALFLEKGYWHLLSWGTSA